MKDRRGTEPGKLGSRVGQGQHAGRRNAWGIGLPTVTDTEGPEVRSGWAVAESPGPCWGRQEGAEHSLPNPHPWASRGLFYKTGLLKKVQNSDLL